MKNYKRHTNNTQNTTAAPSRRFSYTSYHSEPGQESRSPKEKSAKKIRRQRKSFPLPSVIILAVILTGCLIFPFITSKDPACMNLDHTSVPPNSRFFFGTDTLGRDIFSMIWSGGRVSLTIGLLSAAISALSAVILGSVSGLASRRTDALLMRFTDLFLSVPGLLLIVFLQAILGEATVLSLSLVIGLTGWPVMAKVVRAETLRLRTAGYVIASRAAGAGFFYILRRHLIPGFLPSILFMAIMNIRNAVVSEATLSFMGLGLPLETVSWGSMLSLAQQALAASCWWIILIPGLFLIVTLLCVTDIGNYLRKNTDRRYSNL